MRSPELTPGGVAALLSGVACPGSVARRGTRRWAYRVSWRIAKLLTDRWASGLGAALGVFLACRPGETRSEIRGVGSDEVVVGVGLTGKERR